MFYISKIYDKTTMASTLSLVSSSQIQRYRATKDFITVSIDGINSIICEVFDTKDGVCEWYSVFDIIKLVYISNIQIIGVDCEFYAEYRSYLSESNINLAVKHIHITVSIGKSDKSYVTGISKNKMLGLDISTMGTLGCISNTLVKDGVLTLPDYVMSLSQRLRVDNVVSPIHTIVIESDDFDFKSSAYALSQSSLKRICSKDCVLVVNNFKFFSNFLNLGGYNVYSRGDLNIQGLKRALNLWGYHNIPKGIIFYIANKKYIYEYMSGETTLLRKRNNDNEIVY